MFTVTLETGTELEQGHFLYCVYETVVFTGECKHNKSVSICIERLFFV